MIFLTFAVHLFNISMSDNDLPVIKANTVAELIDKTAAQSLLLSTAVSPD